MHVYLYKMVTIINSPFYLLGVEKLNCVPKTKKKVIMITFCIQGTYYRLNIKLVGVLFTGV